MKLKWELTNQCNLRCKYCSNINLLEDTNNKEIIDWKSVIDFSKNFITSIDLLGGEPLLHPQILDIVEKIDFEGIKLNIVTNGQFDKNIINDLLKHNLNSLVVSIEGMKISHDKIRGNNTWEKAINFLNEACEIKKKNNYKTNIGINVVINNLNKHEIIPLIEYTKDANIRYQITHVVKKGNAEKNYQDLDIDADSIIGFYEELCKYWINNPGLKIELVTASPLLKDFLNRKYGLALKIEENKCTAGMQMISIDPYGNVYPCNLFKLPSANKPLNIKDNTLNEVFLSFREFIELKELKLNQRCDNCKFNNICSTCPFERNDSLPEICEISNEKLRLLSIPDNAYFKLNDPYIDIPNSDGGKIYFPTLELITEYTVEGFSILSLIKHDFRNIKEIKNITSIDENLIYEFLLQQKYEGKITEERRLPDESSK